MSLKPRPHLAHLLLAAPAPALRRLGQRRARRRCCWCTAAATIAATGTGWPSELRRRLAHHRAGPARPRRQRVVAGRHLHDGRLHLRPGPAHPSAEAGSRHHRRPFARRQHRAALRRALPGERRQAGRHRGPGPVPQDAGRAQAKRALPERMRDWIDEQRALSGRLPRRYASIEDAFKRMQEENKHLSPEQARHLPCTASTRTRTAPTAGSSTTTCAPGRPTT